MIKKILFFGILLVAIALRFAFLSSVPPSPSLDEATIGWNAYSILHTGRDEYGYFLPILLRAYDDYRPALYGYMVVPFVKVFGLQAMSVRLPSVLMSIATVMMAFFLTRLILADHKRKNAISLLAMFLLAISPWHIYVSRLGHEVNLGLTLVVAGILLFFLYIRKRVSVFLVGSFALFALSFYSYQSEKIFTPLFLLMLTILFWKDLFMQKKTFVISFVIFIFISIPIFFASLSPGALLRLKGTSIFTDNPTYTVSANNILQAQKNHNYLEELMNNRRIVTVEIFFQNYTTHFNPWWLFGNTGNESFKAPNTGLLYMWEFPFLLIGLIYVFLGKFPKQIKLLVACWILIDFIAPGLTTQAPHAMRAYTLLPLPQILISIGLIVLLQFVKAKSKAISWGVLMLVSVIAFESSIQFMQNYFLTFPISQSGSFQYALRDAILYAQDNKSIYTKLVVSNKENAYQSYMFYLFYTKYDPKVYLSHGGTISGGFNETHKIDNIFFGPIPQSLQHDTLYLGNPDELTGVAEKNSFYLLNGEKALIAGVAK